MIVIHLQELAFCPEAGENELRVEELKRFSDLRTAYDPVSTA